MDDFSVEMTDFFRCVSNMVWYSFCTWVSRFSAFWYGGSLIIHEGYSMVQFFIAYAAVIAGAFSAGAIFSFAPDIG
jgi:hypothetical protein